MVRSVEWLGRVIRTRKESWIFSLKYAVVNFGDLQKLSRLNRVRNFILDSVLGIFSVFCLYPFVDETHVEIKLSSL